MYAFDDSRKMALMGFAPSNWYSRLSIPSSRALRALLLALVAILLWLLIFIRAIDLQQLSVYTLPGTTKPTPSALTTMNLTEFQDLWVDNNIGDPFDDTPISRLCVSQQWRSDIALELYGADGGVGNVRSMILDFLYFAVKTGSPIILPQYSKRSETDLSSYQYSDNLGMHSFDHYFDLDFFLTRMKTACPELTIYSSREEIFNGKVLGARWETPRMRPDKAPAERIENRIKQFNEWIPKQPDYQKDGQISVVQFQRTLWFHDLQAIPHTRRAFGRLLRAPPQIRRLVAVAAYNMRERFNLTDQIDPTLPFFPKGYFGSHMRTEEDAERFGWFGHTGGFQIQAEAMLKEIMDRSLKVVYLACGKPSDVTKFTEMAWNQDRINVTSKAELLSGADLEELKSFSWDQQAIFDYEMLSRSDFFVGTTLSSFTWNIATRRHHFLRDVDRPTENPASIQEQDPNARFDDGFSRIIMQDPAQPLEFLCPRGMWP